MLPCNENKRYLYQAIAFNNYQAIVSSLYFKALWVYGINTWKGKKKHTPTNIYWMKQFLPTLSAIGDLVISAFVKFFKRRRYILIVYAY